MPKWSTKLGGARKEKGRRIRNSEVETVMKWKQKLIEENRNKGCEIECFLGWQRANIRHKMCGWPEEQQKPFQLTIEGMGNWGLSEIKTQRVSNPQMVPKDIMRSQKSNLKKWLTIWLQFQLLSTHNTRTQLSEFCCSRQQSGLRTLCQSTIAVLYAAIDYSVPISTCLWLQYQYLSMIPACKSLCFHLPITVSILTWWFINITSRNSVRKFWKRDGRQAALNALVLR